ncbi:unnamed protein product, partial [Brachionus calyciflorus]
KKCGGLNHKESDCRQKNPKCLNCAATDHTKDVCSTKKYVCLNCNGQHSCLSEMCPKIIDKTLQINQFVIDVLIGEKLIQKKMDIFKTLKTFLINGTVNQNYNSIKVGNLVDIEVEERFKKDLTSLKTQLASIKGEVKIATKDINIVKLDVQSIKVDNQELKISTLNTGGLNNNSEYLNKLIINNNIVCIQETWTDNIFKIDETVYTLNNKIYLEPAKRNSNFGRMSVGLAFIIDDDLNVKFEPLNERISVLYINRLAIVNIYLIYENNTQNRFEYTSSIAILNELINELEFKKMDVIIIGDFNTDIKRDTEHTWILKQFPIENQLTLKDTDMPQDVDFTYRRSIFQKNIVTSWIDHIAVKKNDDQIKNVKIDLSNENFGNHLAITAEYELVQKDEFIPVRKIKNAKLNINWNCIKQLSCYQERVRKNLAKLGSLLIQVKNENCREKIKEKLTRLINEVSFALIDATKKTRNFWENEKKKKKKKIGSIKYKKWWDQSIQSLHNILVLNYIRYRDSCFQQRFKQDYIEARRNFRQKKRINLKSREIRILLK